ncbi:MAG: TIGR04013 family B12-binding domain/radical SAM domain-containing protein [Caldimicrobium sp.]
MKRCLVFAYFKPNRYSFNALLGAVEENFFPELAQCEFYFPRTKEALLSLIKEFSPKEEVYLFFSFFTSQYWEIKMCLEEIKSLNSKGRIRLVAGGPHATGLPKQTLEMGFDYVIIGEGEEVFPQFLKSLLKGDFSPELRGLSYFKKGEYLNFGKAKPVDLSKYPPFSLKFSLIGPMEITRGCPFTCKYCQTPRIFGTKPRHRPLDKILYYVEALLKRGIKDLRFITPNAFSYGSPDGKTLNLSALETLLKELARLVKPYGGRIFFGSFPSEVRPEHVTEETIQLVKTYCANDNLIIGAQTGSERLLSYLHRGHTVEEVRRAVKLILKAGLKAKVDFIFGLPGEEEEDIKATVSFMEELAKAGAIIHAHTFMPLPQTPFMKKPAGRISKEVFDFIKRFLPKGQVFGEWEKQKLLSERISKELLLPQVS